MVLLAWMALSMTILKFATVFFWNSFVFSHHKRVLNDVKLLFRYEKIMCLQSEYFASNNALRTKNGSIIFARKLKNYSNLKIKSRHFVGCVKTVFSCRCSIGFISYEFFSFLPQGVAIN